ncbi:MAG: hypothetical protein IJQ16_05705 [Selenomonadaceae bacterium]|nr:hypothetical protein [Selenomonadaceae bacterium]
MKKIFAIAALILTLFTPTTFAEEAPTTTSTDTENVKIAVKDFVEYKSAAYGYKIKCPFNPVAVTDLKFDEPAEKGEMLVFLNDGAEVVLGYRIVLDAFPDKNAPNFNKDDEKTLNSYLDYLKRVNPLDTAMITNLGANNKGAFIVTAKEIENDKGEKITADTQIAMVIFRTPNGGRISIQLLTNEFSQELVDAFIYSCSTFDDSK